MPWPITRKTAFTMSRMRIAQHATRATNNYFNAELAYFNLSNHRIQFCVNSWIKEDVIKTAVVLYLYTPYMVMQRRHKTIYSLRCLIDWGHWLNSVNLVIQSMCSISMLYKESERERESCCPSDAFDYSSVHSLRHRVYFLSLECRADSRATNAQGPCLG